MKASIMPLGVSVLGSALLLASCSGTPKFFGGVAEPALPPADAAVWEDLVAVRSDNWYHLLDTGMEALDWRLRAIDSASTAIDLQSFLWDQDEVGRTILVRLLAAADRGVRVRIVLDDSFLLKQDKLVRSIDAHPRIEYRVFNPYARRGGGVVVRELANLGDFSRLDHRMHNKAMIVDNRVAIVGGRNLAAHYFGYDSKVNFRDMEVLTGGAEVRELSRGFDQYWNDHWSIPVANLDDASDKGPDLPALRRKLRVAPRVHRGESAAERSAAWQRVCRSATSGQPDLFIDRPPSKDPAKRSQNPIQVAKDLERLLDSARTEVILVSAYLIPTPEFEAAIERAESRGVEVRILTNSLRSNNHTAADSAYRHHVKQLISHGADLHELRADGRDRGRYMVGPAGKRTLGLHAKTLMIDHDRVFIGSANLDARSLRINTEMGLLIKSPELNHQVRQAFAPDFTPRNSWHVKFDERGKLVWVGDRGTLTTIPANSEMQRIEDWFFALLPIESEM